MTAWIFEGKELEDSIIPPQTVGFVYVIENVKTKKKYIGRKLMTSTTRKPPAKGQTRRKKVVKESTWREYYGSSAEMKEDVLTFGKESFKREIVRFCRSKTEMAYFETKAIFETDALLSDEYINKWVTVQINGKNLNYLKG